MDGQQLTVAEEGRAVRISVIVRFLHEADGHQHTGRAAAERGQPCIGGRYRNLRHEVGEQISRERKLREGGQLRAFRRGPAQPAIGQLQVRVDFPETRRVLRQRDPELHAGQRI
jgi:hypothetical protein